MKIRARFFAQCREAIGKGEMEIEVEEGTTAAHLLKNLKRDFPGFRLIPLLIAVNAEYAEPHVTLREGDEVAFLPPMSGGSVFQVTEEPIDPEPLTEKVRKGEYGAVVTFLGTVRGHSKDKEVLYLEYDAYHEMAEQKLRDIGGEVSARWNLDDVVICHRMGRVEVGEIGLVVAIGAPHRKEAFAACQYVVNRIKEIVPIWKKEVFTDGEVWVAEAPKKQKA